MPRFEWPGQIGKGGRITPVCAGEKSPDIRAFVAGGIVPDDVDQALVGVVRLNFGEKLGCADAVDGDWVCTAGFDPALTQPKAGFV